VRSTFSLLAHISIGALLANLNVLQLVVLAILVGRADEAASGARLIPGLAAAGGAGGLAYHLLSRIGDGRSWRHLYGKWMCAGVVAMAFVVPIEAAYRGEDIRTALRLFLQTPSMVLLYMVGGALGGYMAGRWTGSLPPISRRPRDE